MELNYEQKKLITSINMKHSLIKGVAGSGKTTVAVNRIGFLLDNYCIDDTDEVLMVTYNKSLIQYISHIFKSIDDNKQVSMFEDDKKRNEKVHIVNIDKLIHIYFLKSNKEKGIEKSSIQPKAKRELINKCIFSLKKLYPDVKLLDTYYSDFLMKEIEWIKACNYMELEVYQSVDRIGRTSSNNSGEGPQRLSKNSKVRQSIFELMMLYDKEKEKDNLVDFEDKALIALDYVKRHRIKKYTHIIIDESQDLSKVQLDFLVNLYNKEVEYSSIMFVADIAQSIYHKSWIIKGRSFASIGFDMVGKSNSLAKNYRTTTQIAESAFALIQDDNDIVSDDNYVKPSLIDRQGSYPVLRGFSNILQEAIYIKNLIKNSLIKNYELRDIAIIARTKTVLEQINNELSKEIKCNYYSDGINFDTQDVKLLTMHSIKGLEFKVVIIAGVSEGVIPNKYALNENRDVNYTETMERKLLYVGMTRATERLYMSYHREPSKFLKQIPNKFLRLKEYSKIKPYSSIEFDKFLFKEEVPDLYNKEEKVRQWLIKELIETYKYPLELIKVEYPVQIFSRKGYVDVVVSIYRNNVKKPYIFAEVKSLGSGIEDAFEQLKSYMTVNEECMYGICTDGISIKIIDRDKKLIEDIPSFDFSMLPSSINEYLYRDFRNNKIHKFQVDSDNNNQIIIDETVYSENLLCKIPLYTEIAAGKPIEIVDEIVDYKYVLDEWISNKMLTFALKVKGDSMINSGIDDGDFVIIKKQATAENGEIVAVDIDNNTTLKTFRKMGSQILLVPENPAYEPIVLDEEQVRIIGIAQGIIKKG